MDIAVWLRCGCVLPVECLGRIARTRRCLGHQHGLGNLDGRAAAFAVCLQIQTLAVLLHVPVLPPFVAVFVALCALAHLADVEVDQERADDNEEDCSFKQLFVFSRRGAGGKEGKGRVRSLGTYNAERDVPAEVTMQKIIIDGSSDFNCGVERGQGSAAVSLLEVIETTDKKRK